MKTLVKSIIVLGRKVPIKRADLRDIGAAGAYCPQTKTIHIEQTLKGGDFLAETLVHEIFHAIEDRAGIGQALDSKILEVIAEQVGVVISENFLLTPKNKK